MKKRLITGVLLVAILLPLVVVPVLFPVFQIVAAFFVFIGAYEMINLFSHEEKFSWKIKAVIMLSTLFIYIGGISFWSSYQEDLSIENEKLKIFFSFNQKIGISLILLSIIMQLSLMVFSKNFDGKTIGKSLSTSIYVGLGVSSIVTLRMMGIRMVAYLFLITVMTDVFAYVYGMLFGKHKMIERISPKKTWEGAIGGTVVATITATLFAFWYAELFPTGIFNESNKSIFGVFSKLDDFPSIFRFLIIAFVTLCGSIVSQIGDLVASRFKRTYDIKDFGNIFPGHGGFLDRFDSSILTSMFLVSVFAFLNVLAAI